MRHQKSQAARGRQRRRAVKVGDVIYTKTFAFRVPEGLEWYWCRVPDGTMTYEEAIATQEHHGPFRSEQEAKQDQQRVLLGKECKVTEGGMWDPAWDKPQ
jgi:hypothetical protein